MTEQDPVDLKTDTEETKIEFETFEIKGESESKDDDIQSQEESFDKDDENPKWCMPAAVTSEDSSSASSSSDEEKTKFCPPIITEGHKFSDGIVWETIEECDEENISSSESDKPDSAMNKTRGTSVMNNMKIDLNEGNGVMSVMTASNTLEKKDRSQPLKPFITPFTHVTRPEIDNEWLSSKPKTASVNDRKVSAMDVNFDMDIKLDEKPTFNENPSPIPTTKDVDLNQTSVEEDMVDGDECLLCPDKKQPPVSKEEIGNISVKNLAKFWEEVSKKVADMDEEETKIQKKWNSMPNLKEKRQLPPKPTILPVSKEKPQVKRERSLINYSNVIKSDDVIDDVDLCRSVSLRDRKHMFETISQQSKKERAKQWKSMPSLKEKPTIKSKVHWEDQVPEDVPQEHSSPIRGRSPVRELMKNFQTSQPLVYFKSNSSPTPVSPLLKTNEIQFKDESLSSSDSMSSSITSSSLSTVIAKNPTSSMLEDSSGEIYTESLGSQGDEGPCVVENGIEYSLTPLAARKNKFEHQYTPRAFSMGSIDEKYLKTNPVQPEQGTDKQLIENRIISSKVPYIEEEKDVLESINIVKNLKTKFLH